MSDRRPIFAERADAVKARVDLVALIGKVVRLSRGKRPRGKCPFHGSTSDSFSVHPEGRYAHCFGCQWHGDAIKFLVDHEGLTPLGALEQLESAHGLTGLSLSEGAAVTRAKNPTTKPSYDDGRGGRVDAIELGRYIWAHAGTIRNSRALRYLAARGVPMAMLTPERTTDLAFCAAAPIIPWCVDEDPARVPHAPALVALMRRRVLSDEGAVSWRACGVHVTWLSPDGTGKMERARRNGSLYPARKMLGPAGGAAVVLGGVDALLSANPPLFVGEGIETTFSGMGLCDAPSPAIGLAVLSLDNLQGGELLWKNGVRPMFDVQSDPARPPVCFAHEGPVTGLIDADMKPLRGVRDAGFPIVEKRGGPIVNRAITTAERATICGTLFVQAWRRAGCARVGAVRARMGRDFNDMAQERAREAA